MFVFVFEHYFFFFHCSLELVVFPEAALQCLAIHVEELTFAVPLVSLPEADVLLASLSVDVLSESMELALDELAVVVIT